MNKNNIMIAKYDPNEPKFILGEIMEEKNITSQVLADKTGIPKRTIDEYRSVRRKEPSFSNGLKIADALEIDPRKLFGIPKDKTEKIISDELYEQVQKKLKDTD